MRGCVMLILNRMNLRLLILTFQKFNEIIDRSEAEANLAEANITEIERLISSANNKSDEATVNLGDAQELAEEAASTAEGARDIANQTQQVRSGLSEFENPILSCLERPREFQHVAVAVIN